MTLSSHAERFRTIARWILAIAYLFVGIVHLRSPGTFLPILPHWVPHPYATILLTGLCEIAGAAALLTRRWRHAAGLLLAAYAVCVFPANIKHAIDDLGSASGGLGPYYHLPRLAFQPVIVWWALFASHVIDWPFTSAIRQV